MAGIADMLFGGGGAQTLAVPQPEVSMADILAGGVSNAAPGAGGSVATAFADSPAPGAVASAGQQANAAAAQEPGILDKARDWATKNPSAAQGLMQGFAALASGRTRGGFVQQMGQFAGVANQTMVEQNAANAAQAQEQQRYGVKERRAAEAHQSEIDNRNTDNRRQEEEFGLRKTESQERITGYREARDIAREKRGEDKQLSPLKMREAKLKLDQLQQEIDAAPDARTLKKLQLDKAKLEFQNYQMFGADIAQAGADKAGFEAERAGYQADEAATEAEQKKLTAAEIARLPEAEQRAYRLGIKPTPAKAPKTAPEIANELIAKNPELYRDPKTGRLNYQMLGDEVKAIQRGGDAPPETQQAWVAARDKVKVGQSYIGPDGKEYIRKQ